MYCDGSVDDKSQKFVHQPKCQLNTKKAPTQSSTHEAKEKKSDNKSSGQKDKGQNSCGDLST